MIELLEHQKDALSRIHNKCILRGDVGSGKSITALAYYYNVVCQGHINLDGGTTKTLKMDKPRDLYIITTAKKRDDLSWLEECARFGLSEEENLDGVKVTIDSWNNIKKYVNVYGAFFIFDEQRLVGSGAWVKAFYKIANKNQWMILSATPGDTWSDYIPVFVANGFYKNKTEFNNKHAVYSRYTTYPKIDKYIGTAKLYSYRRQVLVNMEDQRQTVEHHITCMCSVNKELYRRVQRDRWDPYDDEPIQETGKLCYLERKVTNSDESRIAKLIELVSENPKTIIFYNHNYELDIIRKVLNDLNIPFGEWNGQKHDSLPVGDTWSYVVQYSAGCEGWNCITTNVIIFYSQNYSYKVMTQAAGRINRMNTPYTDLFYYHLRSNSQIDMAIKRALSMKKNFNESSYTLENHKSAISRVPKAA